MRIPIKATAREPIRKAGYIFATSDEMQKLNCTPQPVHTFWLDPEVAAFLIDVRSSPSSRHSAGNFRYWGWSGRAWLGAIRNVADPLRKSRYGVAAAIRSGTSSLSVARRRTIFRSSISSGRSSDRHRRNRLAARRRIHGMAREVYSQARNGAYLLAAAISKCFCS